MGGHRGLILPDLLRCGKVSPTVVQQDRRQEYLATGSRAPLIKGYPEGRELSQGRKQRN